MPSVTINMATTDARSEIIMVGRANKFSADLRVTSAMSWDSAVVDLEYSLATGDDLDEWHLFSPVIQFTSSEPVVRNASVSGVTKVRFRPTTAEPDVDIAAVAVYLLK